MKTSLNHLPQNKQDELHKIASTILENGTDIDRIILYGSYARGDYREEKDLDPNRRSGHASDYDILIITSTKEAEEDIMLWSKVDKLLFNLGTSANPKAIVHDIDTINLKLSEGRYFFVEIIDDGIELYNAGNSQLVNKKNITIEEEKAITQSYFDTWLDTSKQFLIDAHNAFERLKYKKAAFELNQAVESAYKTILIVFTDYIPHEHRLGYLEIRASRCDKRCKNIIPKKTQAEEARFKILDDAYISARYDPDFFVAKLDIYYLLPFVEDLINIVEKICKEKIASLQ